MLKRNIIKTSRERIADKNNNDVIWQATQIEDIDISVNDYVDAQGFGVFSGTEGDIKVTLINGGTVVLPAQSGWIPIVATTIYKLAEGTTATDIKVYI